jgi:hypothetical protein
MKYQSLLDMIFYSLPEEMRVRINMEKNLAQVDQVNP